MSGKRRSGGPRGSDVVVQAGLNEEQAEMVCNNLVDHAVVDAMLTDAPTSAVAETFGVTRQTTHNRLVRLRRCVEAMVA